MFDCNFMGSPIQLIPEDSKDKRRAASLFYKWKKVWSLKLCHRQVDNQMKIISNISFCDKELCLYEKPIIAGRNHIRPCWQNTWYDVWRIWADLKEGRELFWKRSKSNGIWLIKHVWYKTCADHVGDSLARCTMGAGELWISSCLWVQAKGRGRAPVRWAEKALVPVSILNAGCFDVVRLSSRAPAALSRSPAGSYE